MEEEIARALSRKAENTNNAGAAPGSSPISMTSKILGTNYTAFDAKRMSFDENMPNPTTYSSSPLSSILSQSPRSGMSNFSGGVPNTGRRDSLKNLWHLQDFGTE